MKLKSLIVKNFRPYKGEYRIDFSDLTAFIGKNDVGKSSLLEALEIFFNSGTIEFEANDLCVLSEDHEVEIGCVFTDLPAELVLDESAKTSLSGEYLLNADDNLELRKKYDCSSKTPRESVYACALHPSAEGVSDLLRLKNQDLKKRIETAGINTDNLDLRANPAIRKALWNSVPDLKCDVTLIPLDKEDGKRIWESLTNELPLFALFQVDRTSNDEDTEIQDPMRQAVKEALAAVADDLERIKEVIREKATAVAERTVAKLRDIDPTLAGELSPHFRVEPKWDTLFKLALTGENQIPLNKRGSGVRRLVLMNFFRAEAERRQKDTNSPGVIYAIEEPEASQHPHNQRLIMHALSELAEQENCQVLVTTHVPGLASLLPTDSVRYVSCDANKVMSVTSGTPEVLLQIAEELGVLPDNRIRVLACVEGPNDISFFRHISRILHESDASIPDLSTNSQVAFFPLGGSTLQQWVNNRYLRGFGKPEVHIYDRGEDQPPQFTHQVNTINTADDGSYAVLTGKREAENYLHSAAVRRALGITVTIADQDSVPEMVARTLHGSEPAANPWADICTEKRAKKITSAKRRLNDEAASAMTTAELRERDPDGDIESWLRVIASKLV